jgi:hypothetical protein
MNATSVFLTNGDFAQVGRRSVGNHIALGGFVATP